MNTITNMDKSTFSAEIHFRKIPNQVW